MATPISWDLMEKQCGKSEDKGEEYGKPAIAAREECYNLRGRDEREE